jgi:type I restriction enzyme S subunit
VIEATGFLFNRLPKNWRLKKFGQILAEPVRNGMYKKKEFHGRGHKIVNMGELFAYDFISDQDMKRIELNDKERSKYLLEDGDLLFARRSLVLEGSGKCSLVVDPSEEITFESSIIRARLNKEDANPRFYCYFWNSPLGQALRASIATRTAVSGIRGSDLVQLEVPVPSLSTQRKIAAILSAYDDLIENNTGRIAILEQMAQLLYREWFVHFRFPGHEDVEMVDSELGPIPEGWEIAKLSDIADINASSVSEDDAPEQINYVTISSVSPGRIEAVESMAFRDAPSRARRIVKHGDIIWSTVRPNRRSYCLILDPALNLIVSTGFAVITPQRVPYTYLYHALTTDEFVAYLTNNATGAAYPAVNTGDFRNADVLLPPTRVTESFHSIVMDFFDEKQNLHKKSDVLRRTRDLLLPRLTSGGVDVSRLGIDTEGVER